MKEAELRLNNLVMVNYKTDLLSKVTWIQEGSVNVIFDRQPDLVNGVVCSVNDLIPIPLTEEILLKIKNVSLDEFNAEFGLRKIYKLGTGNLKFELNGNEVAVYFMDNLICFKKYLHQLQNMVYVNWDLELEINL